MPKNEYFAEVRLKHANVEAMKLELMVEREEKYFNITVYSSSISISHNEARYPEMAYTILRENTVQPHAIYNVPPWQYSLCGIAPFSASAFCQLILR